MEKRKNVSAEKFVAVYQQSTSNQEVASKLGLTVNTVVSRANNLRKINVDLKKFNRKQRKLNADELNAIIAKINNGENVVME